MRKNDKLRNNKNKHSFRKKLLLESFLATLFVFLVLWLFFITIKISFKPFNYVAKALKEVQLTDMYFSQLQSNNVDTNIVLVNIEDIDRQSIAALIQKIDSAGPRVIGMDVFFVDRNDSLGDPALKKVFNTVGNKLVLSVFINPETKLPDEKYKYFKNVIYGHANLPNNENNTNVIRWFNPQIKSEDQPIWAFSAMIAKAYSDTSFKVFEKRSDDQEQINYSGDINSYLLLNHDEIMQKKNSELSFLKGKIVMIGYLGGQCRTTDDMNDKFYTPVNPVYYGRSLPDMFGLVIHANIVSMILTHNYINAIPSWLLFLVSFFIIYLHIILFSWFYIKKSIWYHLAAKLIQLVTFTAILLIVFQLFANCHLFVQTKYILLGIILSADMLYFYDALTKLFGKIFHVKSIFSH